MSESCTCVQVPALQMAEVQAARSVGGGMDVLVDGTSAVGADSGSSGDALFAIHPGCSGCALIPLAAAQVMCHALNPARSGCALSPSSHVLCPKS